LTRGWGKTDGDAGFASGLIDGAYTHNICKHVSFVIYCTVYNVAHWVSTTYTEQMQPNSIIIINCSFSVQEKAENDANQIEFICFACVNCHLKHAAAATNQESV